MQYQEQVLRFRVMRQMNDAERNPDGNWSLIFSTMDYSTALEVLHDEADRWAKCGDAFKIVKGEVQQISRTLYI